MGKAENLINKQFGKWRVLYQVENRGTRTAWHCKCECDREYDVLSCHLKSGKSYQCRVCADTLGKNRHGDKGTRFYRIWEGIINRCENPTATSYERYGGRNIKVCDSWKKYINFKKDMYNSYIKHCQEFGEDNTSIDRIEVNGNYECNNCKWATMKEQCNNRRNNLYIKINNTIKTFTEWCEFYNVTLEKTQNKYYKNNKNIDILYRIFNLNKENIITRVERGEVDETISKLSQTYILV